ncbi:hypothetical protein LOK49_LG05G00042 [Camellia lanceoleosa]|uniref:Uncharacterized protein n=1 Tax=Camellia lanceoleosa TaxID=1840588 RepID=A0ACC0HN98_9ERIC|nr:hypothetical protein LOK49_LG05G00042 [Camellia lanceoleosa]
MQLPSNHHQNQILLVTISQSGHHLKSEKKICHPLLLESTRPGTICKSLLRHTSQPMTMPMLKDMDKDRLQWCNSRFRFLVFEDIENGTLKAHLNDRLQTPLNWRTRLHIVIGVAAALACCCSKVFILIKDMGHIGRLMVEVFSMRINHIDGEKLYGIITVTDGLGTQSIYNRSRYHYESISPGQTALLTGPARSISASDSFTIDVALKDKDKLSPDDDNGLVTVNYVVLRKALEATVEVTLVNRGRENSLPVYGLLVAHNGNFMNESMLFRKKSDEHVDVRPEQPIPLSRSVAAVPSNSFLIVWAVLMDHNGEIAKGTAEFPAQLSWPPRIFSTRIF